MNDHHHNQQQQMADNSPVGYQDESDIRTLRIPYVFGSSTARDLSYLDFLPAKLRLYNTRLRSARPGKDEPTLHDYLQKLRATSPPLGFGGSGDKRKRDRSVDNAGANYVFGSSTPRELSYLENIPHEFRVYDVKLGSAAARGERRSKTTSFSSTGSGGGTAPNGRSHFASAAVKRRTSSLTLLTAGRNEPPHERRATPTKRLVRSINNENNATTPTAADDQARISRQSALNRSKRRSKTAGVESSSRSPKQEAVTTKQQNVPRKPTTTATNGHRSRMPTTPTAGNVLVEQLTVHCGDETTATSHEPSSRDVTLDGTSPISDEFVIMPAIMLIAETDLGLTESGTMAIREPNYQRDQQDLNTKSGHDHEHDELPHKTNTDPISGYHHLMEHHDDHKITGHHSEPAADKQRHEHRDHHHFEEENRSAVEQLHLRQQLNETDHEKQFRGHHVEFQEPPSPEQHQHRVDDHHDLTSPRHESQQHHKNIELEHDQHHHKSPHDSSEYNLKDHGDNGHLRHQGGPSAAEGHNESHQDPQHHDVQSVPDHVDDHHHIQHSNNNKLHHQEDASAHFGQHQQQPHTEHFEQRGKDLNRGEDEYNRENSEKESPEQTHHHTPQHHAHFVEPASPNQDHDNSYQYSQHHETEHHNQQLSHGHPAEAPNHHQMHMTHTSEASPVHEHIGHQEIDQSNKHEHQQHTQFVESEPGNKHYNISHQNVQHHETAHQHLHQGHLDEHQYHEHDAEVMPTLHEHHDLDEHVQRASDDAPADQTNHNHMHHHASASANQDQHNQQVHHGHFQAEQDHHQQHAMHMIQEHHETPVSHGDQIGHDYVEHSQQFRTESPVDHGLLEAQIGHDDPSHHHHQQTDSPHRPILFEPPHFMQAPSDDGHQYSGERPVIIVDAEASPTELAILVEDTHKHEIPMDERAFNFHDQHDPFVSHDTSPSPTHPSSHHHALDHTDDFTIRGEDELLAQQTFPADHHDHHQQITEENIHHDAPLISRNETEDFTQRPKHRRQSSSGSIASNSSASSNNSTKRRESGGDMNSNGHA